MPEYLRSFSFHDDNVITASNSVRTKKENGNAHIAETNAKCVGQDQTPRTLDFVSISGVEGFW